MKTALVLIGSYFPQGVAISSRMLNFCRLLRDSGYSVHVISGHTTNRPVEAGKQYEIEGITYQVASVEDSSALESFLENKQFFKACRQYIKSHDIDIALLSVAAGMYQNIKDILSSHGVKVFVEQCEWMDLSSYRFGKLDIRYIRVSNLRKKGYCNPDGIISISRFLDDYYKSIGVRSVRIPTILDIKNTAFQKMKTQRNKTHLVFAGNLGGTKELMRPIIQVLAENARFRGTMQFDIYGPSRKQIITNLQGAEDLLEAAGSSVVIHGRVQQNKLSEVYMQSDYSIFVRPERRSSNAGFPTKLAESMAVGTPVITNGTGDIGLYLKNQVNGFLLSDNTSQALTECFEKILSVTDSEYELMRKAARETAELSFDYRNYIDTMNSFLNT